jgi:catechol 2,3-dioxygenase-like lactoylglutathione lyase family enzyme
MEEPDIAPSAVAILPTADMGASIAFFERLGFRATDLYPDEGYAILFDTDGASVHLTKVDGEWIQPDRCAHGVYLYARDVDARAAAAGAEAEDKPWGMREFAVLDPAGTLIRIGWPTSD